MASPAVGATVERPSFAKIAAAGLKPPAFHPKQNSSVGSTQKDIVAPIPHDEAAAAARAPPRSLNPRTIDSQTSLPSNQHIGVRLGGHGAPAVLARVAIGSSARSRANAAEGGGVPIVTDDIGTQISSSSDSAKPQSLDGKSVASGTTFAMDEKESLRPDDSASVKAAEDDDVFAALPEPRISPDEGARAFSDQLREISSMEPSRQTHPPPAFGDVARAPFYTPARPDVGATPISARIAPGVEQNLDLSPDQKLLEALENPRDRVWVLKLEQDVIDFVKDAKESSLNLPQCNSFYRMLAHKMADYYMLGHLVDDSSAAVRLFKTPNCRIPPPLTGITSLATVVSTPPPAAPQMRILRRGVDKAGPDLASDPNGASKSPSETGDGNEDDKKKVPASREEREARYEAARLRIMGSAKPTDSPEASKDTQESRSSSALGKKNKKKTRFDSDDDFEARSAYSNIYTTSFGSDGPQPYGYADYTDSSNGQYSHGPYAQANPMPPYSTGNNGYWTHQTAPPMESPQGWMPHQHNGYDLSADFQRAMSFQQQPTQSQTPNAPFSPAHGQPYPAPQQAWPQQRPQAPMSSPPRPGVVGGHHYSSPGPMHGMPSYAYGELPSQTFGRLPNPLEHPLPGSYPGNYKGRNFNPQSQSFVPGQPNGVAYFPPNGPVGQGFSPAPNVPPQLQRQNSTQSHASPFGSPHRNQALSAQRLHASQQPIMHPLPQPVFIRQPSPSLPLPPKPANNNLPYPKAVDHHHASEIPLGGLGEFMQPLSGLAKWGTPSSLPAKPPPAVEPFDAANKLARNPGAFAGVVPAVSGSPKQYAGPAQPQQQLSAGPSQNGRPQALGAQQMSVGRRL